MLLAHVDHPTTFEPLMREWAAVRTALLWAQQNGPEQESGRYEIEGNQMYALVQDAPTQPREGLNFEAHRNHVDLHYCVGGGEIIEWAPAGLLHQLEAYDAGNDVQFFAAPAKPVTAILMNTGTFAIFFPHEAHMVKVKNGTHAKVVKVVVKISTALLQNA